MNPARITDPETQDLLGNLGSAPVLVLLAAAGLAALWLVLQLYRARKASFRDEQPSPGPGPTPVTITLRPKGVKLSLAPAVSASLRNLSFRDALNFERASGLVEQTILDEINRQLPTGTANATIDTIQVIDLAQNRDVLLARFPEATQALLASRKAVLLTTRGGHTILQAVDATGRSRPFLENARLVDPTLAHGLAKLGTFITGAAHIIAGYDNARRLKQIDRRVDVLISDRSNDMLSELEAIYESIREAVTANLEVDNSHLLNLRFKLKRLRCSWINQVESGLSRMENPEHRSFLVRLFSLSRSTATGVRSALTAQEEPLYLTRFALTLEQMIALSLGEEEVFDEVTVPEVRRQVQELRGMVLERKAWISKISPDGNVAAERVAGACDSFDESMHSKKAA